MTTMNNEDPADPREMMFESFTIQHPYRAGTMEVVPAASMREAIVAERERSHELLQAADHIRAGLEAKLAALRAAASVQADQRAEIDAANAVIDMAYRTLLGEGQEDQGAAYDNACRILGDRIEAARALRKGMT